MDRPINGWNGGRGPWWSELIKSIGPTAVIALGLTFWLTQSLAPVLNNMNSFMAVHQAQAQELLINQQREVESNVALMTLITQITKQGQADRDIFLALQVQTCINTAKSLYHTSLCVKIRQGDEPKYHE